VSEEARKSDLPVSAEAGSAPDQEIDDPVLNDADVGILMLTPEQAVVTRPDSDLGNVAAVAGLASIARNADADDELDDALEPKDPLAQADAALVEAADPLLDLNEPSSEDQPSLTDDEKPAHDETARPDLPSLAMLETADAPEEAPGDIDQAAQHPSPTANWTATAIAAVGDYSSTSVEDATVKDSETNPEDAPSTPISEAALPEIGGLVKLDLNEDLLRSLIKQMIREELEGELGERMTRNIRKLIRQEMLRAFDVKG